MVYYHASLYHPNFGSTNLPESSINDSSISYTSFPEYPLAARFLDIVSESTPFPWSSCPINSRITFSISVLGLA